ncbi:MAG: DUF2281 domain-containing protein [Bacteroidetes bacterium]|nr:MAG: DUF2281 domain-containing protein [Bacteroidota bacterium]
MELKVKLEFNQILQLISQLPESQKKQLQSLLAKELAWSNSKKQLAKKRKAGGLKGFVIYMADDFDAPLDDMKPYME